VACFNQSQFIFIALQIPRIDITRTDLSLFLSVNKLHTLKLLINVKSIEVNYFHSNERGFLLDHTALIFLLGMILLILRWMRWIFYICFNCQLISITSWLTISWNVFNKILTSWSYTVLKSKWINHLVIRDTIRLSDVSLISCLTEELQVSRNFLSSRAVEDFTSRKGRRPLEKNTTYANKNFCWRSCSISSTLHRYTPSEEWRLLQSTMIWDRITFITFVIYFKQFFFGKSWSKQS